VAVDYVYRVEQPHVSGQLAKVCARIADANGLIGDIVTIRDRPRPLDPRGLCICW
jgi:hypothetical protein